MTFKTFTYQARLSSYGEKETALEDCAALLSRVERTLLAEVSSGKKIGDCKSSYLTRFGITARQFNGCRAQLEGKIASQKELRSLHIKDLEDKLARLKEKIPKIKNPATAHQKKRRLTSLVHKLDRLLKDQETNTARLCFGSKKLFRAQFALEENGYDSHEAWLQEWQRARNSAFFCLGSKDEAMGNQTCSVFLEEDGKWTLRLRLPDSLSQVHGKYLIIEGIEFSYGKEVIEAALQSNAQRARLAKLKDPSYVQFGQSISYRFLKDAKGWKIFLTTDLTQPLVVTKEGIGVIGVDLNADHLAVVETDRFGNPIQHRSIALVTYGKSKHQSLAVIGDAVAELVTWSMQTKKPIVLEKLDFARKKRDLSETNNPRYARMLSSFVYKTTNTYIQSRAFRFGVQVKEVHPAYTSLIGRVKFSTQYGLTIHEGAALAIARRSVGVSERLPLRLVKIPDGKSSHLTLSLPARNRDEHVWKSWRQVQKELKVALAAHFRAKQHRSSSRAPPS